MKLLLLMVKNDNDGDKTMRMDNGKSETDLWMESKTFGGVNLGGFSGATEG